MDFGNGISSSKDEFNFEPLRNQIDHCYLINSYILIFISWYKNAIYNFS